MEAENAEMQKTNADERELNALIRQLTREPLEAPIPEHQEQSLAYMSASRSQP